MSLGTKSARSTAGKVKVGPWLPVLAEDQQSHEEDERSTSVLRYNCEQMEALLYGSSDNECMRCCVQDKSLDGLKLLTAPR